MAEFNSNTSFDFRPKSNKDNSMTSIARDRAQLKSDINDFTKGREESLYLDELKENIKYLESIEKKTTSQNKMLAEAKKLYKEINELAEDTLVNYEELLNKNKDILKVNKQIAEDEYNYNAKAAQNIEDRIEREEELNRIQNERNKKLSDYNVLMDDTEKKLKTLEGSNKSMLDAFTNNMDKLRTDIKDLAVIKGIGDITQGLFGNGGSSMLQAYTSTRSQLGITSSQFNQFKNDLTRQLRDTGNMFEFGWKDTAEYMSKLGELNITSQEMAEKQYLAVLQGTKYLGLTTETQAKILKISRDTGRSDLLQTTNETMVQIMNAQLGVSKEQLNQIVSQSADLAEMSIFLGGNEKALDELYRIQTAITSEYGKATSDAAYNILNEIMNNPANNKYLSNGYLAGSYNDIVSAATNGDMLEAFKLIIDSIKNSQSLSVAGSNMYAMNALGADKNIMAIGNSSGSMENVNKNLYDINNTSKDITETIKEFNKSWSDKLINYASNVLSMLPFSEFINLQNAYYAVAGVTMLVKLPAKIVEIIRLLKSIAHSSAIGAKELDVKNPTGLSGILSKELSPLTAIAAGVTSLTMFVNDANKGSSKADEWGTGKVSATIGGAIGGTDNNTLARTLKNAGKYALAGAALGSFFPGIGNVAGWVIGGLAGLVAGTGTGLVGGENIANGLDDMFGRRKDTDSVGFGNAPVVSAPKSSYSGKGAPIGKSEFPWTMTSPFGYRGVLQTSAGPTNPYHNGIDLAHPDGTPIGANNAGTVSSAGTASDGANFVIINSGDGYEQVYWHLNSPSHLKRGDTVREGQLIGYMGMTGHATGPHLHFGYRRAGTSSYVDPISLMNAGTFYPTESGYSSDEASSGKEGEKLLEQVVSADTLSNQAASVAYNGIGDNSDVVNAVNSGFINLNAKLEELSSRQDNQEEVLRQLTSSKSSSVFNY